MTLEQKLYFLNRLKEGSEVELLSRTFPDIKLREETYTVKQLINGSPITIGVEGNITGTIEEVRLSDIRRIIPKTEIPDHYKQKIAEIVE
jgi:hypothetical protein